MTKYKIPRILKIGDNRSLPVTRTRGANFINTFTYWKLYPEITDSGLYVCEAENRRGTNKRNQTVEIIIGRKTSAFRFYHFNLLASCLGVSHKSILG